MLLGMNRKTYIYRLIDPRDGSVKYVGKTVNLKWRGKCHRSPQGESHCARWLKCLRAKGLHAVMEVIETVEAGGDWAQRERFWISYYKNTGEKLCNMSAGGEGWFGHRLSEEAKEKLRQRFKGRPIPAEQRAQISKTLTGKKQSPETIAKRDATIRERYGDKAYIWNEEAAHKFHAATTGVTKSEDQRKKISQSLRGRKQSPKIVAKRMSSPYFMAISGTGKRHLPKSTPEETRAKRSASLKAYLATLTPKQRIERVMAAKLTKREWITPSFEVISA